MIIFIFAAIEEIATNHSFEFGQPGLADGLSGHGRVESVLAELFVGGLVVEDVDRASDGGLEVVVAVALEDEAAALLRVAVEFDHGVFEAACPVRDDRRLSDEEFVLDDAAGLED